MAHIQLFCCALSLVTVIANEKVITNCSRGVVLGGAGGATNTVPPDFGISVNPISTTLQMFTGVYRVIQWFFCNICRETPVIFTDCGEIL